MTKKLLMTLMLATGMAFAQGGSGGSGSGSAGSQSTQPPSGSASSPTGTQDPNQQQQTTPGSTQTTPGNNQSTTSASGSEATVRGCLKQSGGDWILSQSGSGQSVTLKGDSSMLKPHDGHQVEIKGTQTDNNSMQVSSVSMISDSCSNGSASSTTGCRGAT